MKTASLFVCAVAATAALASTSGVARAQILEVPTQYPTIQAAIDAAPNGASITVLPGQYAPFEIVGKSLSIHGAGPCDGDPCPGKVDIVQPTGMPGVSVRNLPAGGQVVISGMRVRATVPLTGISAASISVRNCLGNVLFADVRNEMPPVAGSAMFVEYSPAVFLDRVDLRVPQAAPWELLASAGNGPGHAVRVVASRIFASNTTIHGGNGYVVPGKSHANSGSFAIDATHGNGIPSSLELVDCDVRGGRGGSPAPDLPTLPDGAGTGGFAIHAVATDVRLFRSTAVGGDGGCSKSGSPSAGGYGLFSWGPVPESGPTSVIEGGFYGCGSSTQSAAYLGPPSVSSHERPSILASHAPFAPGGVLGYDVRGEPGAPAFLFLALRSGPEVALPAFLGSAWLDAAQLFAVLPLGVLDAAGEASILLPVPPIPAVAAISVVAQALVGGSAPAWTNVSVAAGKP